MSDAPRLPVVFLHGLWLHATSWAPWAELFAQRGFRPLTPGWPGESATVEETRDNPARMAGVGVGRATEHYAAVVRELSAPPVLVGHSFGGLIAQRLLGMGLARAAVALAPAQFRGVRTLPPVQLRTMWPVLGRPANRRGAVSQTREQFRRGVANAVSREESDELYERYVIPAPGLPLFEAGTANFSRTTAAAVDTRAARGPLLLVAGGLDRTVPAVTVRAQYRRYRGNASLTEYKVFADRGHSLSVDHGWPDVAGFTLDFLARQALIRR